MIDALGTLLAAGDGGDVIEILVLVAFVIISIVGGLIQKAGKAKKEKEEQDAARQRRRERREAQQQTQQGRTAPPQAAGRTQTLQPRQRQAMQLQPLPQVPPKPRPKAKAKTIRKKSLVGSKPAKTSVEDRHVGSAHVGRLGHVEAKHAGDQGLHVDLSARTAARQAMIYHEIFSPPKALRDDKQMWDE